MVIGQNIYCHGITNTDAAQLNKNMQNKCIELASLGHKIITTFVVPDIEILGGGISYVTYRGSIIYKEINQTQEILDSTVSKPQSGVY